MKKLLIVTLVIAFTISACQTFPSLIPLAGNFTETAVPATAQPTAIQPTAIRPRLPGEHGGVIAFYSDRDGNPEIYTLHADGSGVARLMDDPAFDDSPAISPDGNRIAFLTARLDSNPLYPYHRADAPASFLHSSVVEMCHWGSTNLQKGIYQGQRILPPASYNLIWAPVAQRGAPPFREEMRLGWTLGHFEGTRTVGHGGGGSGWTCFLALLPEDNCAAVVLCNEESSAHDLALQAVLCTLLGKEPQPGRVSWMIPIAQALQTVGIQAAYARYEQIKDSPDYFIDAGELILLYYQLMSLKKFDLAIDLLELDLYAFPERQGLYFPLARTHLQKGDRLQAEAALRRTLAIQPDRADALEMLSKIAV